VTSPTIQPGARVLWRDYDGGVAFRGTVVAVEAGSIRVEWDDAPGEPAEHAADHPFIVEAP
jgi:hypothetical protein